MEAPVKRRNNALTDRHVAALYSWLDREREWCAEATAQQCAVRAADQLGFGVTSSNILTAKKALSITKPAPVKPAGECRCAELALLLVRVYDYAGMPPPDNLLEMAGINRRRSAAAPELPGAVVPVVPGINLAMSGTSPLRFEAVG